MALTRQSQGDPQAEKLVHRPLSLYDNAVPSATSLALEAAQRLFWLTGESRFGELATELVGRQLEAMVQNPFGFGGLLCGLDRQLRGAVEVVVVGHLSDPRTTALLSTVHSTYLLTDCWSASRPVRRRRPSRAPCGRGVKRLGNRRPSSAAPAAASPRSTCPAG